MKYWSELRIILRTMKLGISKEEILVGHLIKASDKRKRKISDECSIDVLNPSLVILGPHLITTNLDLLYHLTDLSPLLKDCIISLH